MYGAADQIFEEFIPQVYRSAEDTPENVDVVTGEQTLQHTNVLGISSIKSEESCLAFPYYRDGNEILVNSDKQFNSDMLTLQGPDSAKIADSELIFIQGASSNSIREETKSLNMTSHRSLVVCEEQHDINEKDGYQEKEKSHTKCLGSSLPGDLALRSTISNRTYSTSSKCIVRNNSSQNALHLSDTCNNHDNEEKDNLTCVESAKDCTTLKQRAFNLYVGITEKNIFALHNIDITLPINCDLCHIRFYDMKSFDNHMKSHIDKKHFMCQLCPKTYVTWENLVAHRKAFHQGHIISCNDCSCRKHHLDLGPLRFPVGEFPSGCEECKEGFINSAQLNKHYRSHIPERYENVYVCCYLWI